MAVNQSWRCSGKELALHLVADENEHVAMITHGLWAAENRENADLRSMRYALAELQSEAAGRTEKPLFHVSFSERHGEPTTDEQALWIRTQMALEFGFDAHKCLEVIHTKDLKGEGRERHRHYVFPAVRADGRIMNDGHSIIRSHKVMREFEFTFGKQFTSSKFDKAVLAAWEREGKKEAAAWLRANIAQMEAAGTYQQGRGNLTAQTQWEKRTDRSVDAVRRDFRNAWDASDNGKAFANALRERGYVLARGDKNSKILVAVDDLGTPHAVQRILNQKNPDRPAEPRLGGKVIQERLAGIDMRSLPSVAEAKAIQAQGELERLGLAAADLRAERREEERERAADALLRREDADPADQARELADRLARQSGVTFSFETLEKAVGKLALPSEQRVAVTEQLRQHIVVVEADETGTPTRLAIKSVIEGEAAVLSSTQRLAGSKTHAIDEREARLDIAAFNDRLEQRKGFRLSREQEEAAVHVLAGSDATAIVGVAGAGKSTLMEGAKEVWEDRGRNVRGIALSGIAAVNLSDIGLPAATIQSFLDEQDRGERYAKVLKTGNLDHARDSLVASARFFERAARDNGDEGREDSFTRIREDLEKARNLDSLESDTRRWVIRVAEKEQAKLITKDTVLVLDEAGMVGHRQYRAILEKVEAAGAKLVAVGDPAQLQPIEPGAAFRLQVEQHGAARLSTVIRHKSEDERRATELMSTGKAEDAKEGIRLHGQAGNLVVGIQGMATREETVADAERVMGQTLDDEDRERVGVLRAYAEARLRAGQLWSEFSVKMTEDQKAAFEEWRQARSAAADRIMEDLDGYRPWLARYGVSGEGLLADSYAAQGMRRQDAESQAAFDAADKGLDEDTLRTDRDLKLSFDFRKGAREAMIEDYRSQLDASGDRKALLLASTNDDVDRLGAAAREAHRERGWLGRDHKVTTIDGVLDVAVGDRLMTLQNDKGIGVRNGTLGTVTGIEYVPPRQQGRPGSHVITVELDSGSTAVIDSGRYMDFRHGYSATVHKTQGCTVRNALVLDGQMFDRHLAVVAMSRHKESVRAYSSDIDAMTVEGVVKRWSVARSATNASDLIDARDVLAGKHSTRPSREDQFEPPMPKPAALKGLPVTKGATAADLEKAAGAIGKGVDVGHDLPGLRLDLQRMLRAQEAANEALVETKGPNKEATDEKEAGV